MGTRTAVAVECADLDVVAVLLKLVDNLVYQSLDAGLAVLRRVERQLQNDT
jgi:hypothetical protein